MRTARERKHYREENARYLLSLQRFQHLTAVWPGVPTFRCATDLDVDGWHDLASGDLGICFYLIHAYKKTKKQKYIDYVQRALVHIETNIPLNHTPSPGLFHGFGALAALWLIVFSFTDDSRALDHSRSILLREYVASSSLDNDADIRNGTAALLLIGAKVLRYKWHAGLHEVLLKHITSLFSSAFLSGRRIYWPVNDHTTLTNADSHLGLEQAMFEAATACHESALAAIASQQFLLRFRTDLKKEALTGEKAVIDALFLERLHKLNGTCKKELYQLASPNGILARQTKILLEHHLPFFCENLRLRQTYGVLTDGERISATAIISKRIAISKNSGILGLFSGMAGYALAHDYLANMSQPAMSILPTFDIIKTSNRPGKLHHRIVRRILENTYPLSLNYVPSKEIRRLVSTVCSSLQSGKSHKSSKPSLEKWNLRYRRVENKIAMIRKNRTLLHRVKQRELVALYDNYRQLNARYFADTICTLNPSVVIGDVEPNGTVPVCIVGITLNFLYLEPLSALIVAQLQRKSAPLSSLIAVVLRQSISKRNVPLSQKCELIAHQILHLASAAVVTLSHSQPENARLLKCCRDQSNKQEGKVSTTPSMVVVIPAYNEFNLAQTIESLAKCEPPSGHVLVFVVINSSTGSPMGAIAQNRATFMEMQEMRSTLPQWMTLVTVNYEGLPEWNCGVGVARRIGIQFAVQHLKSAPNGVILSLDADTLCSHTYLSVVEKYFAFNENIEAASIYFEFNTAKTNDKLLSNAALEYELQMKYLRMLLVPAGMSRSFYNSGFQLVFRVSAYVKAGGMPMLQGNEDYVFASRLQSACSYGYIRNTTVYPEARLSTRCCIGDGSMLFGLMRRTNIAKFWVPNPSLVSELIHFQEQIRTLPRISRKELIDHLPPAVANFIQGRGASIWRSLFLRPHYSPSAACDLIASLLHAKGLFFSYGCKRVPILHGAREYLRCFDYEECEPDASLEDVLNRFRILDSKNDIRSNFLLMNAQS